MSILIQIYLPPSFRTYGKSKPFKPAQAHFRRSTQSPTQSQPTASEGIFKSLAVRIALLYTKPIAYK